jgi:hypothetical protein
LTERCYSDCWIDYTGRLLGLSIVPARGASIQWQCRRAKCTERRGQERRCPQGSAHRRMSQAHLPPLCFEGPPAGGLCVAQRAPEEPIRADANACQGPIILEILLRARRRWVPPGHPFREGAPQLLRSRACSTASGQHSAQYTTLCRCYVWSRRRRMDGHVVPEDRSD